MKDHKELHALIDLSALDNVPWQCMETFFDKNNASPWKQKANEVWYCNPNVIVSNMLANSDFNGQFDVRSYIDLDEYQK
jgi:Plavaka transposase